MTGERTEPEDSLLVTLETEVAAGVNHSFFIDSNGGLWGMGDNFNGELGDNSTTSRHSPEQVGQDVSAVAAGYSFSLVVKTDGSLWAMGANQWGQLGDGTTTDRHLPVKIVSSNVVAVAAGTYHSLFLKSDGTLWGMGFNGGILGDGTGYDHHSPVQIVPLVLPQPTITNVNLSGTNLVLNGSNGQAGRTYVTLMSTDLTKPLGQWASVATNLLYLDGSFSFTATTAVTPGAPRQFFRLQVTP